ncbi:MAG: recombinase family protein [Oscillospiraceae bacterium]|nr:recombinase family protein [Oscillospiraceae bacterium]
MPEYRATKYVRLSYADDKKDKQSDGRQDSDSVINQSKLIDDFVKKHPDIEIVSEKIDDGWSGLLFDRPSFKEMMEDIEAGKINCVIVKDLSRFGREYIETGRYLRRIFPAYGVRFIAILDNIDTLTETSGEELIVGMKSIMNEAYSRDISLKTRSALAIKRGHGEYIGACAVYGYVKSEESKNRLAVDDYAAHIVQDIFKMKIEGVSAARIADTLNQSGVLSPIEYKKSLGRPHPRGGFADKPGAKWSATTVIRILKDEVYTGMLIQGRQTTHSYKLKELVDRPASEQSRTENAHEAVIRKHDFDLVQKIMRLDTRTAPHKDTVYLFSGILICGCCGNRMTRKTVSRGDKKHHYYFCPTGKKNGCTAPLIKEGDLTDSVWICLKAQIGNALSLERMLDSIDAEKINGEVVKGYEAKIASAEAQLEQIQQYKMSLRENFVDGIITKDEHRLYKKKYDADIKRLSDALDGLREELAGAAENREGRMMWMEHFRRFQSLPGISRKAVIQLIKSIRVIDKERLEIQFNYKAEYEKAMEFLTAYKEAV